MPATPRSARQERVARVTTTRRIQTATDRAEPHRRAADEPAPARQHPSQEDELLRRARALDAATDREVRVLRRLIGKGTIR